MQQVSVFQMKKNDNRQGLFKPVLITILGQPPGHTQTFCFADNGKAKGATFREKTPMQDFFAKGFQCLIKHNFNL